LNNRASALGIAGLASLVGLTVLALGVGAAHLSVGETWAILMGDPTVEAWKRAVVLDIRLPRVMLAAICGGGLAVAGAAMQGMFRNPMADPGVIGVSAGSSFGAVSVLYLAPATWAAAGVPVGAFVGGLAAALLVYALASRRGTAPVTTLLLAGIAVGGIAAALTSLVLALSLADWEVGRQMLIWLMGGLEGRSWGHVAIATPMVIGGTIWLLIFGRELNLLSTGEESAMSLGVDVARVKRELIFLVALVTGATVAVMGVVGFVGLMVPHIVRLLIGPEHRRLLPMAFICGGIFLVGADLLCRLLPEAELRLGVVSALTGGPFFLYLLMKHRRWGDAR